MGREHMSRQNPSALTRRAWVTSLVAVPLLPILAGDRDRARAMLDRGAIVRGPRDRKRLALVFAGDRYAESATRILDTLRERKTKVACFVTGRFLRDRELREVVRRIRDE